MALCATTVGPGQAHQASLRLEMPHLNTPHGPKKSIPIQAGLVLLWLPFLLILDITKPSLSFQKVGAFPN